MQGSASTLTYQFLVVAALVTTAPGLAQSADGISEAEAEAIGTEAYIYGYPLVTMEMTRRVMTNVVKPAELKAPMGQFINARSYPNAFFRDVTAPNADTLYSVAWLDLAKEPYILHVPNENGRYYLMPLLSAWTNVFASLGTRTTGTKAADFAITGPGWKGSLPSGIKELKSPTSLVWILGRTYSSGTPEDYRAVHAIQDQYTLTPLSAYGKSYTPSQGTVDSNIDMKTAVRTQVNQLDASTFFHLLVKLMKNNPPAAKDAPIINRMAKAGIVLGSEFDMNKLDPVVARGLQRAPKAALEKIEAHYSQAGDIENGWIVTTKTGEYGTDYLQRAYIAAVGLGANLPEDAIYPTTNMDSEGYPLDGDHDYVIHFPKGQLPPAKGFWSLTMYDDQFFFVDNPLNRYSLSLRNSLKYNADGSLDFYIQDDSPGKDKESNWLPAPDDKFNLMLRIYWPEPSVIDGSWEPPAVQMVDD